MAALYIKTGHILTGCFFRGEMKRTIVFCVMDEGSQLAIAPTILEARRLLAEYEEDRRIAYGLGDMGF